MSNILYVHGLGSGAYQGNTIKWLMENYRDTDQVYSFDIPMDPIEALRLVNGKVKELKIDILVATSLGCFYGVLSDAPHKILVNPCLKPSVEIPKLAPVGVRKEYFGRREDGIQTYMLTEEMVKEYEKLEEELLNLSRNRSDMDFIFGLNDKTFCYLEQAKTLADESHIYTCASEHRLSESDKITYLKPLVEHFRKVK